MANEEHLNRPWLVAAWAGMGAVGVSAAYYLISKLGMRLLEEFPAREFFELQHVEVKDGLISTGRLPRSRLFLWDDPKGEHDLVVFIGEAQPPSKGDAFCRQLIQRVREMEVERAFTFAAMATQMRPDQESRVFGAAIDRLSLAEFAALDLEILKEGQISGLNGVLLGVASEKRMTGGCLLGEMPQIFPQFPFPKGSLAVLRAFTRLANFSLDFSELEEQAGEVERSLSQIMERVEKTVEQQTGAAPFVPHVPEESDDEEGLTAESRDRIEALFEKARHDRSRAYELKKELDRLKVFPEYEDRFLDLFREPG